MKSSIPPISDKRSLWIRAALILLAAGALFGLSSCHCYPGHGYGYGGGGYYGGGYGGGGYGGGGYCR